MGILGSSSKNSTAFVQAVQANEHLKRVVAAQQAEIATLKSENTRLQKTSAEYANFASFTKRLGYANATEVRKVVEENSPMPTAVIIECPSGAPNCRMHVRKGSDIICMGVRQ